MSERIDHVAAATAVLKIGDSMPVEVAKAMLSAAQVHATLALVEQQRIANLIAIAGSETALSKREPEALPALYSDGRLRPEIREALQALDRGSNDAD